MGREGGKKQGRSQTEPRSQKEGPLLSLSLGGGAGSSLELAGRVRGEGRKAVGTESSLRQLEMEVEAGQTKEMCVDSQGPKST